ncbi:MAG: hypothetical protein Q4B42_06120, partial [Oscillospiraceae bacterium]|nr:hypothetical protein [Oscillospiraceae bacterium]
LGLTLSGIGVGVFLFSSLGIDPASCFETGVSLLCNISFGSAAALINLIILTVIFFIDKSYINISSLLAIFLIGYVADGVRCALEALFLSGLGLVWRIVFILIGSAVMAIGVGAYTTPRLGVGAIDLVSQIISDKLHLTYRWVRVAGDVLFVVLGWLAYRRGNRALRAAFGAAGTILPSLYL